MMFIAFLLACISTHSYSNEVTPSVTLLPYDQPLVETIADVPNLYLHVLKRLNEHSLHKVFLSYNAATICSIISTELISINTIDRYMKNKGWIDTAYTFTGDIQKIIADNGHMALDTSKEYKYNDKDHEEIQKEIAFFLKYRSSQEWRKTAIPLDDLPVAIFTKNTCYDNEARLLNAIIDECNPSALATIDEAIEYDAFTGQEKKILKAYVPIVHEKDFRKIFLLSDEQ